MSAAPLNTAITAAKLLNAAALEQYGGLAQATCVLVLLAAGKGTRFGAAPKCVQAVRGKPLARHTIDNFRAVTNQPAIILTGYAHEEVVARLGPDNLYVLSANTTGGTAWAAFEALFVPGLLDRNPLLLISMGDRIIPTSTIQELLATYTTPDEAALTLLTAHHTAPAQHGKGRILRDTNGTITNILEQRDIDVVADPHQRQLLDGLTETNCPLYLIRARTLHHYLGALTNSNAQQQYYFTDIVAALKRAAATIRTLTVTPTHPNYAILAADVTRPPDLARLESTLAQLHTDTTNAIHSVAAAAEVLTADRTPGQTASIAAQLRELLAAGTHDNLLDPTRPVAIAVAGGRLRIAFMHPDMSRFYGPAWQMPIGAADRHGREQIVVLVQQTDDGRIHHLPMQSDFREKITSVAADEPAMFPTAAVTNLTHYETFGTHLAEQLLLTLGYFSDQEIAARRAANKPLPPHALWVSNSMRRPFALICNAIASLRTLRSGPHGERINHCLCQNSFTGLRFLTTGAVPQGGFSSSSALTVAVKNALNVLYGFGLPEDTLVHLACQAEYGTGVRAGSLDQATEQKGKYGKGTLISSNPRDNYRTLGTFKAPTERIHFLFPYSVDRDREAWRWSHGCYAEAPTTATPTTPEIRKMTGKAAEIAAWLTALPPQRDFFMLLEADLLRDGFVSPTTQSQVYALLRQVPLLISLPELCQRLRTHPDGSSAPTAAAESLLSGWREPQFKRHDPHSAQTFTERGVPLRAMLAYLFVEVARCFRLFHDPTNWITHITHSQRGDCCFTINPENLPPKIELLQEAAWERNLSGPERLDAWLKLAKATPFDYNLDLDDTTLASATPPPLHTLRGGNFFRGLALLDLTEALLKRAFGSHAVALRVNAAGQGDYFQVHVDQHLADPSQVKAFLDTAFYTRFKLNPTARYVEPTPGGGAAGIRLDRFDLLPTLITALDPP